MLISDQIAELLDAMLLEGGGILEIKRNEIAGRLGCSPSQINYVIASRFSPERGYLIESRRGGGGYIRIVRRQYRDSTHAIGQTIAAIRGTLRQEEANALIRGLADVGAIGDETAAVIAAALSDRSLPFCPDRSLPFCPDREKRDTARALLFKRMLLALTD